MILAGNEEQKKNFLGRMTEEPLTASYCVTEPGAGSDVAGLQTTAEKKGNDWVINGTKMWITGASKASWFFILAKVIQDPAAETKPLFTGFLCDANTQGIIIGKKEAMLGQRTSDTRMVTFQDLVIPDKNRLGAVGDGFKIALAEVEVKVVVLPTF